jgi:hypothetical protein
LLAFLVSRVASLTHTVFWGTALFLSFFHCFLQKRTIVVPQWFTNGNFLDCPAIENPGVRGLCDAAVLTLGTGYAIGCLVALVLNGVLPNEDDDSAARKEEEEAMRALIPSRHGGVGGVSQKNDTVSTVTDVGVTKDPSMSSSSLLSSTREDVA